MISLKIVARISKTLFLSMTLCTSLMRHMKTLIVILLSTLKLLQKSGKSIENGIIFPDPVKNPIAFPVTINIPVLLKNSITLVSFSTRTVCGKWFQQHLCHSTTLIMDILSNQYPQPTTHQHRTDSYPVLSSSRRLNSKRKGLRVSFAFFQRNYLPDGRVNETVATAEELTDLWKPGAMDRIPAFVMNCNCD